MTHSLGARRAMLVVGATSLAALLLTAPNSSVAAVADPDSTVFINELHYDNIGTDTGEFVEVAAPAGEDLTGWSIVRYNGANGLVYGTDVLSGTVGDEGGGFGTVAVSYPTDGLQNGAPDGIALIRPDSGGVEQFLSYEGSFTATAGPANGLTSTDIGVSESSSTAAGFSLGLTGSGGMYGAFTWAVIAVGTPDAPNNGQTFTTDGPTEPAVSCPATVTTPQGTATTAQVSATDADSAITSIEITSPAVAGITLSEPIDGAATLQVADTTAAGDYPVVIEFTSDDDQVASCTVTVVVQAPPTITLISEIQGSGPASLLVGQDVVARAVVTSLFTRQDVLDGFFVQEENADGDDSEMTSEGLLVFCRGACPSALAAGDLVQVSGEVAEFEGMTQIVARTGGSIRTLSSGNTLPSASPVDLPAPASTRTEGTFETVEGMIVAFPDELVVSEFFELARFGQLVVTADAVPYQFTHDNAPDGEAPYQAYLTELNKRRIFLDDDNNDQNDAISNGPDEPYPYPTGGLALNNRFRVGDSATGLTGVMHWSFAGTGANAWRIRPIPGVDYTFEPDNPAPAAPADVGGRLKVATFNVLNYFTTIDTTSSGTVGPCGPSGMLDCRGADSTAELERQRAKLVTAIAELKADIVGLIEIQNDVGASTADLVAALNTVGAGPYAAIDTGTIGTDAIKVAFIYRTSTVTPVGDFEILDSSDDVRFRDDKNRPVLIQTFDQLSTGERLTVAVNHFKSKGSACDDVGDPDLMDGQGNCPVTRRLAAEALADFLATDPTGSGDPDVLIVGDLNSYRREPPITALVDEGYTDLIDEFIGDEAYSFLFDGQLGYLDHALATSSLVGQVTGVAEWAINADEVPLFDYNDTVHDVPGEATFERESAALPLYEPDERRSSDHNPLVVGLDLDRDNALIVTGATIRTGPGARVVLSGRITGETFTNCPTVALRVDGTLALQATTSPARGTSTCAGRAANGAVAFDRATGAISLSATLPSSFVLTDNRVRFELTLDDERFVALVTGRRSGAVWSGPV